MEKTDAYLSHAYKLASIHDMQSNTIMSNMDSLK